MVQILVALVLFAAPIETTNITTVFTAGPSDQFQVAQQGQQDLTDTRWTGHWSGSMSDRVALRIYVHNEDNIGATLSVTRDGNTRDFLLTGTYSEAAGRATMDLRGRGRQSFVLTRQDDGSWIGEGRTSLHVGEMVLTPAN